MTTEGTIVMGRGFGVNVWWTVPGLLKDGKTAQEALVENGFSKKDMPLPTRRAEVSRAAYSFQNRQGKENRRVTEKALENGNSVVYGILDKEQKDAESVGFEQTTTIRFIKDSGIVMAEGALKGEMMTAFNEYKGKITDEDVRAFLRSVIRKSRGVAKRPSGGIYFVPDKFSSVIESAKKALAAMDCGARIYVERVTDGKQERDNVWNSVEEDVRSQIEATLEAVGRIEKRSSSIVGKQAKLEELSELVEVYKELLGEEAKFEAVAESIEDAVKKVSEKMTQLQQGTASSVIKAVEQKEEAVVAA
jgi:hypothetical protein